MKKWRNFLACIILLAAVLVIHHFVTIHAMSTLPESALVDAVTPVPLKVFFVSEQFPAASPILMDRGVIGGNSVTVFYTARSADSLFGLSMKYGGFDPWQDGYIVVSDRLAISIFLTDDVLGAPIELDGKQYIICGVYALDQTLLGQISRTTETDVYLPLASYPDQDTVITELLVDLSGASGDTDRKSELRAVLGTELIYRSVFNFSEIRRLASQSSKLHWLVFALLMSALAGLSLIQLTAKLFKAGSASRVFFDHRREVILYALLLLCFAAGLFWIKSTSFPFFLPQDFIVHKGSVIEYIVHNLQLVNYRSHMFLCAFSRNVKLSLIALDACFVFLFSVFAYRLKKALNDLLIWEK